MLYENDVLTEEAVIEWFHGPVEDAFCGAENAQDVRDACKLYDMKSVSKLCFFIYVSGLLNGWRPLMRSPRRILTKRMKRMEIRLLMI